MAFYCIYHHIIRDRENHLIQRAFKILDVYGKGLNIQLFTEFVSKLRPSYALKKDILGNLFRIIDVDGDGLIDIDEFRENIKYVEVLDFSEEVENLGSFTEELNLWCKTRKSPNHKFALGFAGAEYEGIPTPPPTERQTEVRGHKITTFKLH